MRRFVFERNRSLALNIAHDVDQLFAEKIRMMKVVVTDPAFRSMQVDHQTKVLQEMVANYADIHISVVIDSSGRQVARSDGLPVAPVIDYSDRGYFAQVMQNKKTAVSDVLVSKSAGWPGVVIAEPIFGEDRSVRGLLVVNIGLSSIIRMIDAALVDQQSYVYVVNKAGQVIIHTDPLQAKMMKLMPVIFSVMFFFFPAGLVLYWVVNNILTIAQQWYINKTIEKQRKNGVVVS